MCEATKTAKGVQLPCPCCGETMANISLHLASIGEGEEFTCGECDTNFSIADIKEFFVKWTPVLAWIGQIPTA